MRSDIKKSSGWLERVEVTGSLAHHLQTSVAAYRAGRLNEARKALDESRNERSRLMRMRSISAEGMPESAEEITAMRKVGKSVKEITAADEALAELINTVLEEKQESELDLEETNQRIVDRAIPSSWDMTGDLVIVVGKKGTALREVMANRGYKRLILLREEQQGEGESSPAAGLSIDESRKELETYREHPPHQLRMVRAGATAYDTDELARKYQAWLAQVAASSRTQESFGQFWSTNSIHNIPNLLSGESIKSLEKRFKGMPAVVVAPGPSLSKNIDVLVENRERFVVFAVSHVLKTLLARGITPDFVVNIDPQPIITNFFTGIDTQHIPGMLFAVSCEPKLWELPGNKYYLTTNSKHEAWLGDFVEPPVEVPTGGTVSHAAVLSASFMGCTPILLMGHDLAFTGGLTYDKQTKADETPVSIEDNNDYIYVEGQDGEQVLTSFQFNEYREWFERFVETVDIDLINCTEGGAKIKGLKHAKLVDELPATPISTSHRDIPSPSSKALLSCLKKINQRIRKLEELERVTKRCLRISKQMLEDPLAAASLNSAETDLKQKAKGVVEISVFLAKRLQIVKKHGEDLRELNQAVQFSIDLYTDLATACETMRTAYNTAAEKVRANLQALEKVNS